MRLKGPKLTHSRALSGAFAKVKAHPAGLLKTVLATATVLLPACGDGTLDPIQKLADRGDRAPFAYSPLFQKLIETASSQITLAHFLVDSRSASLSAEGTQAQAALNIPAESGFSWESESLAAVSLADSNHALFSKRLHYRGIPVQLATVKHISSEFDLDYATGSAPVWLLNGKYSDIRASSFDLNQIQARDAAAQNLMFHAWHFGTFHKVYLASEKSAELKAAYRVQVSTEKASLGLGRGPSVPLEVLLDAATGEILSQVPLVFHFEGTTSMYRENRVASATAGKEELKFKDLIGDGSRLETDIYKVLNCSLTEPSESNCPQKAQGPGGDYRAIPYEAPEYNEMVSFYAINRAMDWYRNVMQKPPANGPEWRAGAAGDRNHFGLSGTAKMKVFTRAMARTSDNKPTPDNAQYYPSVDGGEAAKIVVGTGWEDGQARGTRALQYLGRDTDVTMHEFGHHVIYRALRVVNYGSQSLNMHEGFADFFTYAITGNNLLGESIFTPGGPLRHGSVSGNVNNFLKAPPHIAGQFWSSVLWETRGAVGAWDGHEGVHKFDKIAWDAIDLLKENANYYDAIGALGKSAENFANANGENASDLKTKIYTVFFDRGFVDKPDGSGNLPAQAAAVAAVSGATGGTTPDGSASASTSTSNSSKSKSWFCGVVAAPQSNASTTSWVGLMLLALGLVLPLAWTRLSALSEHTLQSQRVRIPTRTRLHRWLRRPSR